MFLSRVLCSYHVGFVLQCHLFLFLCVRAVINYYHVRTYYIINKIKPYICIGSSFVDRQKNRSLSNDIVGKGLIYIIKICGPITPWSVSLSYLFYRYQSRGVVSNLSFLSRTVLDGFISVLLT